MGTVVLLSFICPFIKYLFGATLVLGIVFFKKRKKGNGQSLLFCNQRGGRSAFQFFHLEKGKHSADRMSIIKYTELFQCSSGRKKKEKGRQKKIF